MFSLQEKCEETKGNLITRSECYHISLMYYRSLELMEFLSVIYLIGVLCNKKFLR